MDDFTSKFYSNKLDLLKNTNDLLNKEINNRTRIIEINEKEYSKKNNKIFIMNYFLYFLIFLLFLSICVYFNLFSGQIAFYVSIVSFIIFLGFIMNEIYLNKIKRGQYKSLSFAENETIPLFDKVYQGRHRNGGCPHGCTDNARGIIQRE